MTDNPIALSKDDEKKKNHWIQSEIFIDIMRIDQIIDSEIFEDNNKLNTLVQSAFIEMMICLRDLMYKCEKYCSRVSFTDDVIITSKIKDVTDLIEFIRNAVCHLNADNHFTFTTKNSSNNELIKDGKGSFNRDYGNTYQNDLCFSYGEQKICLNRHIIRAFNEAKAQLVPLLEMPFVIR